MLRDARESPASHVPGQLHPLSRGRRISKKDDTSLSAEGARSDRNSEKEKKELQASGSIDFLHTVLANRTSKVHSKTKLQIKEALILTITKRPSKIDILMCFGDCNFN